MLAGFPAYHLHRLVTGLGVGHVGDKGPVRGAKTGRFDAHRVAFVQAGPGHRPSETTPRFGHRDLLAARHDSATLEAVGSGALVRLHRASQSHPRGDGDTHHDSPGHRCGEPRRHTPVVVWVPMPLKLPRSLSPSKASSFTD